LKGLKFARIPTFDYAVPQISRDAEEEISGRVGILFICSDVRMFGRMLGCWGLVIYLKVQPVAFDYTVDHRLPAMPKKRCYILEGGRVPYFLKLVFQAWLSPTFPFPR